MQYQPCKPSRDATIQCSNCNKAVDIGLIAEHSCAAKSLTPAQHPLPYPTGVQQTRTPPSPAGSFRGAPQAPRGPASRTGPQRPVLPRLDSSLSWQSGQLTPASSGQGSTLASPVSTTSSRNSRTRTRRPIMRAPSPELISQDCAFPPFPGMGASKPKPATKDGRSKSRNGQSKRSAPASTPASARSSSSSPLSHSRTISSTSVGPTNARGRSRSIAGESTQRPTTAPDGHAPEFGSQLRKFSVPIPAVPAIPPPLLRAETTPVASISRLNDAQLARTPTFHDVRVGSDTTSDTSPLDRRVSGREPSYKSKRPPPIESSSSASQFSKPLLSPAPPSARSLKRTLTEKLFGRKPSNGRRSMVRAALSDEPEPMPTPPMPPIGLAPASAPPARPAQPSYPEWSQNRDSEPRAGTSAQSPVITVSGSSSPDRGEALLSAPPEIEQARHDSFAALEGTRSPHDEQHDPDAEGIAIASPTNEPPGAFDLGLNRVKKTTPTVADEPEERKSSRADVLEATQRLSVDSASSYGSIGFTDRTFSSRSSPPPVDEVTRRKLDSALQPMAEEQLSPTSTPERPTPHDPTLEESPTDPYCIAGRLSPLPPRAEDVPTVDSSLEAQIAPQASVLPRNSRLSSGSSVFSDYEDEATRPSPGFRPRKESLAGAPAPLFHKPGIPVRKGSQSTEVEARASDEEPLRARHTARQDSLASVSSRSAIKGTCRGCSKLIMGHQKSVTSADGRLSGKFHKDCFACHTCKEPFATAEFYVHADNPYCGYHYHQLEDSLCATCGKGIEGVYMETANVAGRGQEKHHPACLKCATCRIQLTEDYFELSGQVYCERDAFRLAKHPRVHSRGPARPSPLVREYIRSTDPGAILGNGSSFPERRVGRAIIHAR